MSKITKYILVLIAIIILVGIGTGYSYFSAEYLDEGSFLTTSTIKPDSAVRIQTTGDDLRLYEYTPPMSPHMQCMFVAGTNKGDNTCILKQEYILRSQCDK